jgi:lactoylglutathione lyase
MKFRFNHSNINVFDLEKSLAFYEASVGFREVKRLNGPEGSFIIVYLSDGSSAHKLELTWLKDRQEPYQLGDNEVHLCLTTDSYPEAHKKHQSMGCICFENPAMGLYFINDPDGYWIEIIAEEAMKIPT